jgi:hypothetical protein
VENYSVVVFWDGHMRVSLSLARRNSGHYKKSVGYLRVEVGKEEELLAFRDSSEPQHLTHRCPPAAEEATNC